jgi:putative Mn2+ efflux pump MntP
MVALLVLALALSADAFAVALTQGASARASALPAALRIALAFGAAQAIMPLAGWGLGLAFAHRLEAFDHWIAFAILSVLGVRTFWEGVRTRGDVDPPTKAFNMFALAAAALATSLDAAAAGLTFSSLGLEPLIACAVIGVVTALVSFTGVYLGRAVGAVFGGVAEIIGGVTLIAIGVSILWEHGALRF